MSVFSWDGMHSMVAPIGTGKVDRCSNSLTSWISAVRSWLVASCASASALSPKTLSCWPSIGFQIPAVVPYKPAASQDSPGLNGRSHDSLASPDSPGFQ